MIQIINEVMIDGLSEGGGINTTHRIIILGFVNERCYFYLHLFFYFSTATICIRGEGRTSEIYMTENNQESNHQLIAIF